jgi:hypothetical protein
MLKLCLLMAAILDGGHGHRTLFVYLKKKYSPPTHRKNIQFSRYSDKKVSPYQQKYIYSPNVPICGHRTQF